jgi:hypothetical protein
VVLAVHFAWTFLAPADRIIICITYPVLVEYVCLRQSAVTDSVARLRHLRPPPGKPTNLDPLQARLYGAALLRFNFVYGDFIRWLSGEYTNRKRDWESIFNTIHNRPARVAPDHLPPPDLDRGFRINTEGVPLVGNYTSPAA